jgi:D-galacturonate reductase
MSMSIDVPMSFPFGQPVALKRQFTGLHEGDNCDSVPVSPVNVLMIGTGEYTTGYVHGMESDSDKGAGVVALTMFDLRRRGKTGRLGLAGVNGTKFPGIRAHMKRKIVDAYKGIDITCETFPLDDKIKADAYLDALNTFKPGDAVTIFTPDDTHFEIALACIERGLHVMVTKPIVKTLEQHRLLHEAAMKKNVLVSVEVHKRWDPIYIDARDRIQGLGPFSYMYSYMSQPKHQLDTFKAWAGKSSDISYYLNSHHVDFHEWCVGETARPVSVVATASTGIADAKFGVKCEDTITLTVQWEHIQSGALGTGVYTSSWIAPKSDVHSQQRFFYMGHGGEVNVDQAHRGYNMAADGDGFRSVNPLFMKYTPSDGHFNGQRGYGYRSFEEFIDAAARINARQAKVADFDESLASIAATYRTTAILEAGRRSLDAGSSRVTIKYGDQASPCRPTALC